MGKLRRFTAERLKEKRVLRRIGEMVLSSYHVAYLHQGVIDRDREIVCGVSIGLDDHEVIELGIVEGDVAASYVDRILAVAADRTVVEGDIAAIAMDKFLRS